MSEEDGIMCVCALILLRNEDTPTVSIRGDRGGIEERLVWALDVSSFLVLSLSFQIPVLCDD